MADFLFHMTFLMTLCGISCVYACPSPCDCKTFTNGTIVHCRYQALDRIPQDFPEDTVELDFGSNDITEISSLTFQRLPKLRKLVLDNCYIQTIGDRAFSNLPSLEEVQLKDNIITNIHYLAFEGSAPSLRVIDLENNKLSVISELLFEDLNLKELILRGNELDNIPSSSFDRTQIKILDISYNRFQALPSDRITRLSNGLKVFKLVGNERPLTLPVDIFKGFNLDELDLSGNQIEDPAFLQHVYAKKLKIGGNKLFDLDLRPYPSLEHTEEFYFQNASLESLSPSLLSELKNVKILDVSNNKISLLDGEVFQYVPYLQKLVLSHNQLSLLQSNFGKYLSNLSELELVKNEINTLIPEAFEGLSNITKVDLSFNLLQIIPEEMGPVFDKIKYLNLQDNPIHCNCEMKWFRIWLESRGFFTNAEYCYTPNYDYIWNLLPKDFTCDAPNIFRTTVNSSVLVGQDQMLVCMAQGDPAPEVEWINPSGRTLISIDPSHNRTNYRTFGQMKIQNMHYHQAGIYTCVASNIKGNTTVKVELKVVDELPIVSSPSTTTTSTTTTTTTTTTTEATTSTQTTVETTTESLTTESPSTVAPVVTSQLIEQSTVNATLKLELNISDDNPPSIKLAHKGMKLSGPFIAIIVIVLIACIVIVVVLVVLVVMMRKRKFVREYDVSPGKQKILDTTDPDISKDPMDLPEPQADEKLPIDTSTV